MVYKRLAQNGNLQISRQIERTHINGIAKSVARRSNIISSNSIKLYIQRDPTLLNGHSIRSCKV
jgi:hypothetical protein